MVTDPDEVRVPRPAITATGSAPRRHLPWWLLTGAAVLTQLLTMISGIIAARLVGVEGRGQLLLVGTLSAVAAQATLGSGLPDAITRLLAVRDLAARDGLRGHVRSWLPLAFLGSGVAAVTFLLIERDAGSPTRYLLAAAVVLSALQLMAARLLMGAMLGEGSSPLHIVLTGVVPQLAVVATLGAALALGAEWGAVEVVVVTVTCTAAVLVARLRVLRPSVAGSYPLDRRELVTLSRNSQIASLGPLDGLGLDRLLVGALLGTHMLGLYGVAFAFAGLANILGTSFSKLAIARVAFHRGDPAAERSYVSRTLLLAAGLLLLVVLALEVTMRPLILLTFGPAFVEATDTSRWVVLGGALLSYRRVLIGVLQGRDQGRYASVVEISLLPVLVGGVVAAALLDNLQGVGVALVAVGLLACALLGLGVVRTTPPSIGAPQSRR